MSDVQNATFTKFTNQNPALKPAAKPEINPVMAAAPTSKQPETDNFISSQDDNLPKIGFFRIIFSRLTNEQIASINETKMLPKNAKFMGNGGYYGIHNNFFNIFRGTRRLPEGYEVRKDFLGFTKIVLKDSEGLLLRKKPVENK